MLSYRDISALGSEVVFTDAIIMYTATYVSRHRPNLGGNPDIDNAHYDAHSTVARAELVFLHQHPSFHHFCCHFSCSVHTLQSSLFPSCILGYPAHSPIMSPRSKRRQPASRSTSAPLRRSSRLQTKSTNRPGQPQRGPSIKSTDTETSEAGSSLAAAAMERTVRYQP